MIEWKVELEMLCDDRDREERNMIKREVWVMGFWVSEVGNSKRIDFFKRF